MTWVWLMEEIKVQILTAWSIEVKLNKVTMSRLSKECVLKCNLKVMFIPYTGPYQVEPSLVAPPIGKKQRRKRNRYCTILSEECISKKRRSGKGWLYFRNRRWWRIWKDTHSSRTNRCLKVLPKLDRPGIRSNSWKTKWNESRIGNPDLTYRWNWIKLKSSKLWRMHQR